MIDPSSFNPDINHHIKPFRDRKLGRAESFDLVMYKYIRLEYVINMLDTGVFRFEYAQMQGRLLEWNPFSR